MRDLFVVLGLWLISLTLFAYDVKPTPEWVKDTSQNISPLAQAHQGSATLYHLVDRQLYFDGSSHRYYRFISTPLNTQGLDDNGKMDIVFSESYQRVELHHIRLERDGKTINLTDKARISQFRTEDQTKLEMYNGYLTLNIQIKDLRVGDKLDVAYSIVGSNPILDNFFSASFNLAWQIPVEKLFIRVVDNSKTKIHSQNINTHLKPVVTSTRWGTEHQLEISPTDTIIFDDNVPLREIQGPLIAFSNIDSWKRISQWAEKLFVYNPKRQSSVWRSWVDDVAAQPNDEAKVLKALSLVQDNIRYVGIEIGVNSHKPRDPSEVIDNRYGDCKDKTLLLVSLLRHNNIEAYPVFVSFRNRGAIKKLSPSVSAFDHVITEVNINDEKYWIDGTSSFQKGGSIKQLGHLNFEYGLSLSNPDKLSKMPVEHFSGN